MASESASSGKGAARLAQTVKASMSTLPAVLAKTLAEPQKKEAKTTRTNGPRLAPANRVEPMTAIPAKATSPPRICDRRGHSLKKSHASATVKNACACTTSEASPCR